MGKKSSNGLLIGASATALALFFILKSGKENKKPIVTTVNKAGSATDFFVSNYPFAVAANKVYPQIPIEIFLSFSGVESGFGKHAPKFNFFGTKTGKNYTGQKQLLKTTEILPKSTGYNFPEVIAVKKLPSGKYHWTVRDYFRAFNSPLEAYLDFGKFITSGRYKKALGTIYSIDEIVNKIQKIWAAGYATDPNYVSKHRKMVTLIKDVIKKNIK